MLEAEAKAVMEADRAEEQRREAESLREENWGLQVHMGVRGMGHHRAALQALPSCPHGLSLSLSLSLTLSLSLSLS